MGLRAASIRARDIVVVSGVAGSIGHLAGAMARGVFGAKVIGVDLKDKCSALRALGHEHYADILLDAPGSTTGSAWADFSASLLRACAQLRCDGTLARAADALIVCANSPSAFDNMQDYVCDGGRISCVG